MANKGGPFYPPQSPPSEDDPFYPPQSPPLEVAELEGGNGILKLRLLNYDREQSGTHKAIIEVANHGREPFDLGQLNSLFVSEGSDDLTPATVIIDAPDKSESLNPGSTARLTLRSSAIRHEARAVRIGLGGRDVTLNPAKGDHSQIG